MFAKPQAWTFSFPHVFIALYFSPTLTVAIVEEVGDGCRGAAAPGFGGVDGGEDGGHEPLVAVHPETLLAELGVVVGQTEQVTWCTQREREKGDFQECYGDTMCRVGVT